MKFNLKSIVIMTLSIMTASLTYAQGDVQDLVGARGSSAENGFNQKGYTHIKTTKSGSDIYSYWWKAKNQTCVCAYMTDGSVKAITKTMPADCNKNIHGNAQHVTSYVDVQDLKGWFAPSAYDELRARGFKELHKSNASGRTYTYWHNKETGQCIEVEQYGEDISGIYHFDDCNQYMK